MQGFYLFTFFGVGSLYPLLSVYLQNSIGLNGYQIGIIMSIGPIIFIFFQPIWGFISDSTNRPILILQFTTLLAGVIALGYIFFEDFYLLLLVAIFLAIFQSAIIPISDSITLKYTSRFHLNYGNIRLFGSLGFGIAVFVMGKLSEFKPTLIFIAFFLSLALSSILSSNMPKEKSGRKLNILKGLKEILTIKRLILFLIISFLIFGPNLANNTFFGLFVQNSGGTYAGIGIAFLIAVLSEIPFMKASNRWIQKIGLLNITLLAGGVSLIRWLFYYTEPSLWLIYGTAALQGVSIGLFVPAALQYIREVTPDHLTATAITLYSAIGNGLGSWFNTFTGGYIYEKSSIYMVYLFFTFLSLVGILLNYWLVKEEKEHSLLEKATLKR
ncbi:MFS transporter [Bacillus sp. 03113]|uniref:MFS transporter n=1 Tax=Bacillus sp. 03113 TaxID=2578211 RepID=UPI0015E8BA8D|nr:MFS transporter [Bacillus sp. 03113]